MTDAILQCSPQGLCDECPVRHTCERLREQERKDATNEERALARLHARQSRQCGMIPPPVYDHDHKIWIYPVEAKR